MENRYFYLEYRYEDTTKTHACFCIKSVVRALKGLNLKLDSKILDVGCGAGNLVNALYNLGFSNVWGFDASESGVHLAKKSFLNIADRFFKHNAYEPKLPEGIPQTYDLIISIDVIEHLYSPEIYLENLHNWLNNNGYLIITTPYHGYVKNLAIVLANKSNRHFNPLSEGGHIKFFSKKSLFFLLQKKAFEVISFKGLGRAPYIWKSMILVARKK